MGKIAVIGDVMLDVTETYHPTGRVNPENKDVPLLSERNKEIIQQLGGAANLAANIKSLLGAVLLIGPYNKTAPISNEIRMLAEAQGMQFEGLLTESNPIVKRRIYSEKTPLARIDDEEPIVISSDHKQHVIGILRQGKPTHIVISDYIKGTIDEELTAMVKQYALENNVPVLVDTKPKHVHMFENTYLVKPNFMEFKTMTGKDIQNIDEDIVKEGLEFVKRYKTNLVVTRSEKGATLVTQEGEYYHIPIQPYKNNNNEEPSIDVTGAGDTFLAALTVGLSHGLPLQKAVELGNKASGIAVSKKGTSIVTPDELYA